MIPPLRYHGISDIGLLRDNNEDAFLFIPEYGIFVVADGLGGHQAGEVASKESLERFKSKFLAFIQAQGKPLLCEQFEAYCLDSLQTANREIFSLGQNHYLLQGMGTTFSAIGFFNKRCLVFHVGDSRIYRYRQGLLDQLTTDHLCSRLSIVKEKDQNSKGFLTKALGTAETIIPQHVWNDVYEGDLFLLCSDGLSDAVPDQEIAHVLSLETLKLEEKARMLIHVAKSHRGQDNITVVLIEIPKG